MPVPTPEQLVAEMLAKQRAEAEAEHQRRIAEWEAAQRAKFEEEVAERRREVRERYGMDPLGVFLAQRYEWTARQQFESSLLMEKSRLQREFEESWRRYEESVKPSLLESAAFWLSMGYPQYAGRYAPVSIPEGARITRVTETPEGLKVEYSLAETAQRTSESARREMERRSAVQSGPAGPPEYLGLPQPPLPEGAINPIISIKEATPVGVKAELIYWVPVPGERGLYQPVKQEVYIAPGEGGGGATYLSAEQAREKAMQIAREQLAPSLPAGFEVKSVEIKPEGIEAKIGPTEAYVRQVEELVRNYKEWAKSVEPTDIERVQHMVRVGAYLSSLIESFKQYNVTLPSVSEEYARAKAMHESWVQASVDFWTRMGRPELGGRYPPIELPKNAVITKIEETSEGLRVEYATEEQLRLQKTLEESREKWERFGAAEYAGKYEFPGMLEGYRIAGKTVLPGVGEVYEAHTRSEYRPPRPGLPVPDVYAPEKAYIKLEEAGGELLVTILTPQQVAQIQETKRSEELWRQLGLEEYAGKYLFPGELEGYRVVGKTTLPEVGEVYVLAGPPYMELSGYLKIAEKDGQLLYSLISAEQASALKMREEWKKASVEFWTNLGLSEYAGKYAPLDQLTGYKLAGYIYGTEGRYVILEKDGEKIYAQFREEGDKLTATIYPKNVFEELFFVKTTGQPTIKSLSLQAYEWAENINIPVIEELAKHLVGAFSFVIDMPAYQIAKAIGYLTGKELPPAQWPPAEDIAYSSGFITGAATISLLAGGLVGIPVAATLKTIIFSGGITAAVTTATSFIMGQPITPGRMITATAMGMTLAGVTHAGYIALAGTLPASIYLHPVKSLVAQAGISSVVSGATTYVLSGGDVQKTLIAAGLSAALALGIGAAIRWGPDVFAHLKEWFKVELAGKIKKATEFEYGRVSPEDMIVKRETFLDLELRRAPRDVLEYLKQLDYQTVRLGGREIAQTAAASGEMGYFEYGVRAVQSEASRPAEPYVHAIRGERYLHGFALAKDGYKALRLSVAGLGRISERFMVKGDTGAMVNIAELATREYTGAFFEASIDPRLYLEILKKLGPAAAKWIPQMGGLTIQQIAQLSTGAIKVAPSFVPVSVSVVTAPVVLTGSQGGTTVSTTQSPIMSPIIAPAVKPIAHDIVERGIITKPELHTAPAIMLTPAVEKLTARATTIYVRAPAMMEIAEKPLSFETPKSISEVSAISETLKMAETYVKEAASSITMETTEEAIGKTIIQKLTHTQIPVTATAVKTSEVNIPLILTTTSPLEKRVWRTETAPQIPVKRKGRELGFIYERMRPITAAEEQLKKLKRELKVDPHVFLKAPTFLAKKKVKADITNVGGETRALKTPHFSTTSIEKKFRDLKGAGRRTTTILTDASNILEKQRRSVNAFMQSILREEKRKKRKEK
ncbi:MAG: hypothetical protein QW424_03075 [Candidatus Bathyarchaeia archaeon]